MSGTAKRLMDLAEAHIRDGGYTGFSFRNLAAEVGIKSANVHHHFPTKAKMAAAVARRYGDRFLPLNPPSNARQEIMSDTVIESPEDIESSRNTSHRKHLRWQLPLLTALLGGGLWFAYSGD